MESIHVPDYNLHERLGQGSFAEVYKAQEKRPGTSGYRDVVAIKCIAKSKLHSIRGGHENLIREIEILRTLCHRHIVVLYDFKWDKNYIYLIMDYCSGGDLSTFIRSHTMLKESVARKFLRQLAAALRYLRSKNISHMDLKPRNILLATRYRPVLKLADFGLAQHLKPLDLESSFRGSPLYMAPEILCRQFYDHTVDLWSTGVILYECLFGHPPIQGDTVEKLVHQISHLKHVSIPAQPPLSSDCKDLLQMLLKPSPHDRINFTSFFNHPFVDLDNAPTENSLPTATEKLEKAVKMEEGGRRFRALKLYADAIHHFILAKEYADDELERNRLGSKADELLNKAETLKKQLKAPIVQNASVSQQNPSRTGRERLRNFWTDTPQVEAALTVISNADELASYENWTAAVAKYRLAIDSMLKVLDQEPAGERRNALLEFVNRWLSKAEQIQNFSEAAELMNSDIQKEQQQQQIEEEKPVRSSTPSFGRPEQCCLQ